MMKTAELMKGMHIRLVDFGSTEVSYRQRLLSLGITRGIDVKVVRKAPLGCPIQIDVRGSAIAIRMEEARHLEWELV